MGYKEYDILNKINCHKCEGLGYIKRYVIDNIYCYLIHKCEVCNGKKNFEYKTEDLCLQIESKNSKNESQN